MELSIFRSLCKKSWKENEKSREKSIFWKFRGESEKRVWNYSAILWWYTGFEPLNCLLGKLKRKLLTKGRLILKCPFGFIVWTKLPTKLFLNFCPEIFCTFLGASWKLFGASCRLPCLWYYILSPQEDQRASMKPPGSYKKNSGQKSRNNFVGFLSKRWNQKDILKLTDL